MDLDRLKSGQSPAVGRRSTAAHIPSAELISAAVERRPPGGNLICLAILLALLSFPARGEDVWILGDNSRGQKNIPLDLASVLQISCGREHLVALQSDGTVSAWGYDGNGRATPPRMQKAVSVSAGTYHSLALLADGSIVAWGANGEGLSTVPKGASNVIQVAAGSFHNLALRADGTVLGWGFNGENRATPPAGLKGVAGIAAGRDHSVALKRNGRVVAWGLNDANQCDSPSSLDRVIAVAAGDFHTLALRVDGTVAAWGANQDGQSSVPAGLSDVIAVAAGHRHSVALKADGTAVAWGYNGFGQTDIPAGASQIATISAGGLDTVLLSATGPRITKQPLSRTVLAGRQAEFSVGISGADDLTYQWIFNGLLLSEGKRTEGSSDITLTLPKVDPTSAGLYALNIYAGGNLMRTANALLVVRALSGLHSPGVGVNGDVRLSFGDAEGEPLTKDDLGLYQLQWSPDLAEWFDLAAPLSLDRGEIVATDTPGAGSANARFYRLIAKR